LLGKGASSNPWLERTRKTDRPLLEGTRRIRWGDFNAGREVSPQTGMSCKGKLRRGDFNTIRKASPLCCEKKLAPAHSGRQVSKRLVSKRPVFKFVVLIKQK
jgi:hypothetical protein